MADTRLQEHCYQLNAMGWVRASGNPYIVASDSNGKQHITRNERTQEQPA